ncbi:hypothetical protein D8Y24_01185 [Agrococcus lahaulensis]|nr:hypothetical protein D8Y24_01185 [Agrococcus lahaulensis]
MRRILIVQSRPEDEVAAAELEAMVRFGRLDESRVQRVRLDREQPAIDLADVDAVLVGGGPANFSDDHRRPPEHAATVTWLRDLAERVIRDDLPYLGACLGLGALVHALGGRMVEVDDLVAAGRAAHVEHPQAILARFAERYGLQR